MKYETWVLKLKKLKERSVQDAGKSWEIHVKDVAVY